MDVFRAVMAIDELSERALSLTSHVIDINAAHYTAWHYRRRCLAALGKDLEPELRFIEQIAEENPKNYQIWYHRRVVVERHGDASHELPFVSRVLEDDAKNYHAWSHRQWCLLRFGGGSGNAGASGGDSGTSDGNVSGIASASASGPGKKSSEAASSASAAVSSSLWSGELMYLDGLLADDVRNNSAWNHRWFVVHNCGQQVRRREKVFSHYPFASCSAFSLPDLFFLIDRFPLFNTGGQPSPAFPSLVPISWARVSGWVESESTECRLVWPPEPGAQDSGETYFGLYLFVHVFGCRAPSKCFLSRP
ncbi:unnamed protein product [Phaeothamnion confervicola]